MGDAFWFLRVLPPHRSTEDHFYGFCITFLTQTLQSFHVACPLPQKARWQSIGDSITDTEMPLPLHSSLLSTQRLFSMSGLSESCQGSFISVNHLGWLVNGVQQPFQTQSPNTPQDCFRKGFGAQAALSYQLYCNSTKLPSLGFLLLKLPPHLDLSSASFFLHIKGQIKSFIKWEGRCIHETQTTNSKSSVLHWLWDLRGMKKQNETRGAKCPAKLHPSSH